MNNDERNTFTMNQITEALIALLRERELAEITIREITTVAQVSRNSFYRNYATKEDILKKHIRDLLKDWMNYYEQFGVDSHAQRFGSLFKHLKKHGDFYLLVKQRGLLYLLHDVLMELSGPKPEQENIEAYTVAFVFNGIYGWIEEWIARGMQESAETMTTLLASTGMQ